MNEYNKTCVICNKEYKAKRKHSETCSEACRAQKNATKRAMKMISPIIEATKPLIIAEARTSFEKEQDELHQKLKELEIRFDYGLKGWLYRVWLDDKGNVACFNNPEAAIRCAEELKNIGAQAS